MSSGGGSTPSPPAPPRWEHRWGAIAIDLSNLAFGGAANKRSPEEAAGAALINCERAGGTDCNLKTPHADQCAALVQGKSYFATAYDHTESEAIIAAMKRCQGAKDPDCHAIYVACSPPVRIQ